jgi:crotonobetainyl-CoA:carnitine CoA-transferase CaiB-like acyl-CoA transferase
MWCPGLLRQCFFADQGAGVLKIEPIGGDITRRSRATIDKAGGFSALFISTNRGKRAISPSRAKLAESSPVDL